MVDYSKSSAKTLLGALRSEAMLGAVTRAAAMMRAWKPVVVGVRERNSGGFMKVPAETNAEVSTEILTFP